MLAFSTATYLYEFAAGVVLLARPHELWIIESLCYVIFASFVLALNRAWTFIRAMSRRRRTRRFHRRQRGPPTLMLMTGCSLGSNHRMI